MLSASLGEKVPAKPIAFLTGGTDAAELARAGAEATSLVGMPWDNQERSSVYHTPRDVLAAVSEDSIATAIALALDLARELDQELAGGKVSMPSEGAGDVAICTQLSRP